MVELLNYLGAEEIPCWVIAEGVELLLGVLATY
jgi:hypothetical protein